MEVGRDMERARKQERGFSHRPHFLDLIGAGGMPEEAARELAYRLVKRAREEGSRHAPEAAAPSPEEVQARREARRRRES
jgi:hypothetical protein